MPRRTYIKRPESAKKVPMSPAFKQDKAKEPNNSIQKQVSINSRQKSAGPAG
jgi:hypothetical protein